jgi:hypothetical protein
VSEKRNLELLGKVFAEEIAAAFRHGPPIMQFRPSKALDSLVERGMLEPVETTLGGRFPVVVKGYVLTHRGRLAYCESCVEEE